MKIKILILEDDPILLETLKDEFESIGYIVDIAKHGNEALEKIYATKYDIYIFDICVPYIDGLSLLDELRKSSDQTPTILLTSKNREEDKILGFQKGCDDYITKPFSLKELQYRLQAILNRIKRTTQQIEVDDILIDLKNNHLQIQQKDIQIDKKTLEIFHLLLTNPNTIFSYEDIVDKLYQDKIPSTTVIRVHISKINSLFETKIIKNRRGVGYQYNKI